MRKPNLLRAAVVALLPDLDPDDRLHIRMDKGTLVATGAAATPAAFGWEYRYTLTLTVLDFAGDPDLLFFAVLDWVRLEQREIFDAYVSGRKDGISFEVEVLDKHKVDVELRLDLTEAVTATRAHGGALTFEHHPEPADADQLIAQALGLEFPSPPAPLRQIIAGGDTFP